MTFIEILLTPVYILLFYLYFRHKGKRLGDKVLQKYHIRGFWLKMLACILFVIYYTYLTGGDTRSLFFPEGHNLYRLLLQDSNNWQYIFDKGVNFDPNLVTNHYNIGYFKKESNFMIIRLTALLSFLTFGYYTPISLFFASFAYSGLWKLFMFFYEQRPKFHRAFAISILFFPSVVFWSSGLIKDTVTIGALGWFTYAIFHFLKGHRLLRNGIIVFVSVYLISVIKVYILLAYAPFLLLYLLLLKMGTIRVALFKYLLTFSIIVGIVFIFSQTYSSYEDELGNYAVENLTSTMSKINQALDVKTGKSGAESNFNLGAEFNGTFEGLLKVAPFAIAATFYRPFIWETNKISQLLAAVESLVLMYFTVSLLFKAGPFRTIKYILSDPLIIYCLLFALIFGLFVGASTPNFGSLVRYKIPCMPFYAIALFLLHDKVKARKKARAKAKALNVHRLTTQLPN